LGEQFDLRSLDGAGLILDRRETDDGSIVAFSVPDCDAAFRDVTARGAAPLEGPEDKPYGVRAAYVRGPGGLSVEFEQAR
jgi:predicted enzyme related to lactoylglutathione lyase